MAQEVKIKVNVMAKNKSNSRKSESKNYVQKVMREKVRVIDLLQ